MTTAGGSAADDHGSPGVSGPAEIAAAIEALVRARPPLLVVADFDGTLAIGTRDPGAAVIEPGARRGLRSVARIGAERPDVVQVVVLTGRAVSDVTGRVRVGGIEYHGDHGLEHGTLPRGGRADRIRVSVDSAFDAHRDPAEALAAAVPAELGRPSWLFVERKGPSVAFHVRQADDVAVARAAVVEAIARVEARLGLDHGLAHYRGRSVIDLRPRSAGGKREAVERLLARHRAGSVVVLGDELSDVDAFEAVVAARRGRPGRRAARSVVGVTVAVHGATRAAPAELLAVADLRLRDARAVGRLLSALARSLSSSAGRSTTGIR